MKNFTKLISAGLIVVALQLTCFANETKNISADEALQKLKEGNARFVEMKLEHPDQTTTRRNELTKGQLPFVAILSCSDSRVPPEVIFDQGLGDIFTIRNAGNVKDDQVIGSIEYAVAHCGVNLVVVMGHEDCGAVKAALAGAKDSNYIISLMKDIQPAVAASKGKGKTLSTNVEKTHATMTVSNILNEDNVLSDYVKNRNVKIIPAYYHLDTGKVEFIQQ